MQGGFRKLGRKIGLLVAAALLNLAPAPASIPAYAAPKQDKALKGQLLGHMRELASDAFMGRNPGTEGEVKTLGYIGKLWSDIGLVSGTNNPAHPWFEPVKLVAREPAQSNASFARKGHPLASVGNQILMLTSGKRALLRNSPFLFVGRGTAALPPRSELAGRVALLLDETGNSATSGTSDRQNALLGAGAAAVLTILDGSRNMDSIAARRRRSGYALASEALGGDLEGFIGTLAMDRLLKGEDRSVAKLEEIAARPDFVPFLLDLTASFEATTRETTIRTYNAIGKLEGRKPESGAVLFLAHWDHFGRCAEPPATQLNCNGAIDNASGVAALIEIARRLSKGTPPDRDIYFLATTAEELGLLGAEAFAENPPLPLKQIVAAFNLDSIAIAPAGTPLAMVGRGMTKLDADIAQVAKRMKYKLSDSTAGNAYVRRQDGWALLQHDVPAVMVTSAYGDIGRIEAFFESDYHRPSDQVKATTQVGGAAQDVLFHVGLARWFGDTKKFANPAQ